MFLASFPAVMIPSSSAAVTVNNMDGSSIFRLIALCINYSERDPYRFSVRLAMYKVTRKPQHSGAKL